MLAVAGSYCYCMVQTYAEGLEDITSDKIVNFNQLLNFISTDSANVNIENGQTIIITSTLTGATAINITNIDFIDSHKYYFCSSNSFNRFALSYNGQLNWDNSVQYIIFSGSQVSADIVNRVYLYSGETAKTISFNFIDLTAMFGETVANTITLEQCKNLFTAPYYDYTEGTPVVLDSLQAYNEGMNYILNKYQTSVLNYGAFSSAYIFQPLSPNPILEKYIDYEVYSSPYFKFRGYLAVPLNRVCKAGEIIKFNYNDPGMGGAGGDYLWAGILYSNSFVPIVSCEQDETGAFSFVCPFDTDTFMLSVSNSVERFEFYDVGKWVGDFTVEGASIDLDSIISAAVAGYKNEMTDYYSNYYGRYGEGYAVIFEEGKAAGIIEANTSLNVMDYVKTAFITLGEILNIEVFPNFTLGSLFVLPIITSAIFFVIKIAKGGGD